MNNEANKTSFKMGHKKMGGFSKGDKHSPESKAKVSLSLSGKVGINARRWKGDKAGYVAVHMWVSKYWGKATHCENEVCVFESPKRFEWANISKRYQRIREDWLMLCPSCHRRYDNGSLEVIL